MAKHRLGTPPAERSERSVGHGALMRAPRLSRAARRRPRPSWRSRRLRSPYVPQVRTGLPAHLGCGPGDKRRSCDLADQAGDPAQGFVKVDKRAGRDPEHRLFAEVHIPAHKRRSYDLCKALFDNYRLDQTKPENNRPEEAREILALLEALTDSAPMAAAREHLRANAAPAIRATHGRS